MDKTTVESEKLKMESGQLPKGWVVKELNDVCEVEYGTRVVRKRDGGTIYPVYGGGGATFFMDTSNRENCLVVARFAMSEKCTRFVKGKFFLNDSGLSVKPKNNKEINQEFLNLQFLHLNDYIYSLARGTAQKNLNVPVFRKIKIHYPKSLTQQKQIVKILDQAFTAIDKAKNNTQQNLLNAKQLFESYLQNVFENKGDDWEEKELKDLGLVQTGTTPPTKDKSNYGDYISFAKPPHFNKDGTIDTKDSMLSEKGLKKGRLFPANSILMVCIGATIGKTGYSFNPISSNQQINALTPNENYDTKFLYYALISKFVQKQIMAVGRSSQATLPIINKSKWSVLKINVSKSIQEQQKIVKKLNALQAQTKKLESIYTQKIADLEELKSAFLQKAFNGQLLIVND